MFDPNQMFEAYSNKLTEGSDKPVLPNVAYGAAPEQPSTPAGNGFGQFFFGSLDKALNYALQKDAFKMQTKLTQPNAQAPLTMQIPVPQQMGTGTVLLLGLAAVAVVVMVARK